MEEKKENKKETSIQIPIPQILASPISKAYINHFQVGYSSNDIFAIAFLNGSPQFVINMSFSTAKQFANDLISRIKLVEDRLQTEIKSIPTEEKR